MKFIIVKRVDRNSISRNTVYLIKREWNDYWAYETLFFAQYSDNSKRLLTLGDVKIGSKKLKEGDITDFLESEFNRFPSDFFSLGQSSSYYSNIMNLGESISKKILKNFKDIVYNKTLYNKVKKFHITTTSIMRSVSSYTIENQFLRIIRGGDRLSKYSFSYFYPNFDDEDVIELKFEVEPESFPPTNIQVVVGRNGVGKTHLLKMMLNSICKPETNSGSLISNDHKSKSYKDIKESFPNIVCVSFSPFEDFSNSYIKMDRYSYIGINASEDGINKTKKDFFENFWTNMTMCFSNIYKTNLWFNMIEILSSDPIFDASNIVNLADKYENRIVDFDQKFKEEAKNLFERLSTGHKMVLLIITGLVALSTEKTLVLIDEPENHLHPPLLSSLIRALSELLLETNAVALIATHSPVVLQEVPKKCVWKINRSGKYVSAERPLHETFANSISLLTNDVFGLEVTKSGFHKMLKEDVESGLSFEEIKSKYGNEIGIEGLTLLLNLIYNKEDYDEEN